MDGRLLGKHVRRENGGAGELLFPRAAATDEDDNLLLCDGPNQRLQVMTLDGEWHTVRIDKKMIGRPRDAVVDVDNVYVLCALTDTTRAIYHYKIA